MKQILRSSRTVATEVANVRRPALKRGLLLIRTTRSLRKTGFEPPAFAARLESLGVREITLNSCDRGGTMQGYGIELVRRVSAAATVSVTLLRGAGSPERLTELVREFGTIGAAAGSLFLFKGAYRATLINSPRRQQKNAIASAGHTGVSA